MKKSNGIPTLFLALICTFSIKAQSFTRIYTHEFSLLHRDLITIAVLDTQRMKVKFWKYAHAGLEVAVTVPATKAAYLDHLYEHYAPVVDTCHQTMRISFPRLYDIVTLNQHYWKDEVDITLYLPKWTRKKFVIEEIMKERNAETGVMVMTRNELPSQENTTRQ